MNHLYTPPLSPTALAAERDPGRRSPGRLVLNVALWSCLLLLLGAPTTAAAQTVAPPSLDLANTAICEADTETRTVSITLGGSGTSDKVDIFLLFDDTGSFAGSVSALQSTFTSLIPALESSLPGVEFGFGVGRFEDYGGPGTGFSSENTTGRPFTLNQPIITTDDAGGQAARDALISAALSRTAPGFGGDGPESAIAEGLYQVATGAGFDGDGNSSSLDSGPAGAAATQTSPGTSGDVPPFSSNVAPASGSLGGVGFRSDAQKIVLLATDVCSIAAFDAATGVPVSITGTGGTELAEEFGCSSSPGSSRFGFVSDSKTSAGNTVSGAVVPAGAATVPQTIDALNDLGIQVVGIGPGASPTPPGSGPSFAEDVFLSALARITGAVSDSGDPLVFNLFSAGGLGPAIIDAIETTTTAEVDIELEASALPAGLSFSASPALVTDVGPGETATFTASFTGDGTAVNGTFDLLFKNASSGLTLGTIPVTVTCGSAIACEDAAPNLVPASFAYTGDEYADFENVGASDIDLSSCAFATWNPFTERIRASVDLTGTLAPGGVLRVGEASASGGDVFVSLGDDPLYDGPGAFSIHGLDASDLTPGKKVTATGIFSSVVASLVYLSDGTVYGQYPAAGGPAKSGDPLSMLRAFQSEIDLPSTATLEGNYPNPFNPQTTIRYALAEASDVTLTVIDALGREVRTLVSQSQEAGRYEVVWDGRDASGLPVASGVYLYTLRAGTQNVSKTMLLAK